MPGSEGESGQTLIIKKAEKSRKGNGISSSQAINTRPIIVALTPPTKILIGKNSG
jgi:hypothetical protein